MRRVVAVLLVVAACSPLPDDPFFLGGHLIEPGGAPAAGIAITAKAVDNPQAPVVLGTALTDEAGTFLLQLPYASLVGPTGRGAQLAIDGAPEPDGRVSGWQLDYRGDLDVELPDLTTAELAATASGGDVHVDTPPLADDELLILDVVARGEVVWRESLSPGSSPFATRLLDGETDASLVARRWRRWQLAVGPTALDQTLDVRGIEYTESAPLVPDDHGVLPVSRGTKCRAAAGDWLSACPYTDGSMTPVPLDGSPTELVIDLGRAVVLRHAVLRAVAGDEGIVVSGAASESGPWAPLGLDPAPSDDSDPWADWFGPRFIDLKLDDASPVRFVRLTSVDAGFAVFSEAGEVSLFDD